MGMNLDEGLLVRIALNAVTKEWETFVQSILGGAALPSWTDMWAILRQEELRRFTKRQSNSNCTVKVKKEEEEDAALASKGQRQQGKKKRDLSKVRCVVAQNVWTPRQRLRSGAVTLIPNLSI